MLSILIPTFNYDITTLVSYLHKQLIIAKIDFEIICLDDVSDEEIIKSNKKVNNLSYTTYKLSNINNGIAVTRQLLCNNAKYDWILLLDADTELKDELFISNYLNVINSGYDLLFGGFDYKNIKPPKNYLLRWKYGKQCEAVNSIIRNKNPYKVTIAANLLVKKETFKSFDLGTIGMQYGVDYLFGALLKERNAKVLHIDNQVYHLGIEKSEKYLIKKERAAETLLKLYHSKKIKLHDNNLLSMYINLNKLKLNYVFSALFALLKPILKFNLIGKNPKVMVLQFYKISYMCFYDLKQKSITRLK